MARRKLSRKTIMERRRSGESIAALARRFNISAQSLYNFRTRQQNSQAVDSEFLPVHVPQQIPSSQALTMRAAVPIWRQASHP